MKLLKNLELGFKRTIFWNKYQWEVTQQRRKRNLDFLIDINFQGINKLFALSF